MTEAAVAVAGCLRASRWRMRSTMLALLLGAAIGTVGTATANAANLPDGRRFELVSAPDTFGNPAVQSTNAGVTAVLPDGRVIYGGGANPDGPSGSGFNPYYVATRTGSGWTTASLLPAHIDPNTKYLLQGATRSLLGVVFATGDANIVGNPPPGKDVPAQLVHRDATGNFELIGSNVGFIGMDADGQTVVVASAGPPTGPANPDGRQHAYAWHVDGTSDAIEGPGTALADCGVPSSVTAPLPNVVSSDGSIAFLQSNAGIAGCPDASQLYVSDHGMSREVSAPDPGVVDTGGTGDASMFIGATPDGSTAYFKSSRVLTSDADGSSQLYRWTATANEAGDHVSCVTCGLGSVNDTVVSSGGNHAYAWVVRPDGSSELVESDGGAPVVVDTDQAGYNLIAGKHFQLSPDGKVVVFDRLVIGPFGQSDGPLFRSVVSPGGASTPQCVSCQAGPGVPTLGLGQDTILGYAGASTIGGGTDAVSADGDTIAFQSTTSPNVTDNGQAYQVYQWTPSAGDQFIATGYDDGQANGDAAITPDARDIFFDSPDTLTFDAVQPGVAALYDARIGGGFAPPPVSAPCSGDACQGAPSTGAVVPPVGSVLACCGNLGRGSRPTARTLRPTATALRLAAHTGRLRLRVRVFGSGTLRVRVQARLKGKQRQLASASRRISQARTRDVTIQLFLSKSVRAMLQAQGQVSVVLTTSIAGVQSRLRLPVKIKTPHMSAGGSR